MCEKLWATLRQPGVLEQEGRQKPSSTEFAMISYHGQAGPLLPGVQQNAALLRGSQTLAGEPRRVGLLYGG